MPTAARLEKQSSNDLQEPQKLVHNLVEKKIRNLEKRKVSIIYSFLRLNRHLFALIIRLTFILIFIFI
jgi:hypothetical protein